MGKKKGGKRMSKKQMTEALQTLFGENPNETYNFKYIFKALKLDTHPLKMLAIDTMEEMAWDDYLTKVSDNSYRLNTKTQVQEGRFRRKPNGKNSFVPDDGSLPIFAPERNSMSALDGDRVQVTFMARRQRHIKEAIVTAILERARDTFVGRLRVEKDFALLITPDNILAHDIIIPKKKLKGGKNDEKAVVKVIQWPDANHRNMIGEVVDVLGKQGENDVEMHAILAQYGLPYKYPKAVEDAANKNRGTRKLPERVHVHHRPARRQGLRRRPVSKTDGQRQAMGSGSAHSRRIPLCHRRLRHRQGGPETRHERISRRPHHTDAARAPLQLHLLAAPRRGQAGLQRDIRNGR